MSPDIVAHLRIIEDSLAFILLSIAGGYFTYAIIKLKNVPVRFIPIAMIAAFFPLYFWKSIGGFRRIFLDEGIAPSAYESLHHVAEVFESLSGLVIAVVFLWLLRKINNMSGKAKR